MKIITRTEFLELPSGTVFWKYTPHCFGDWCIKACGPSDGWKPDFLFTTLTGDISIADCHSAEEYCNRLDEARNGAVTFRANYDDCARDGLYDETQLFVVCDKTDIIRLMEKLALLI